MYYIFSPTNISSKTIFKEKSEFGKSLFYWVFERELSQVEVRGKKIEFFKSSKMLLYRNAEICLLKQQVREKI